MVHLSVFSRAFAEGSGVLSSSATIQFSTNDYDYDSDSDLDEEEIDKSLLQKDASDTKSQSVDSHGPAISHERNAESRSVEVEVVCNFV